MIKRWLEDRRVKERAERLKASIALYAKEARRDAAIAANDESGKAALAQAFGSRCEIETAKAVEAQLAKALPRIFTAYTDERGAILLDAPILRDHVRDGIEDMFEEAQAISKPAPAFGEMRETYSREIDAAKDRALEQAEEHFRRPGLKPWHQRFLLPFGATAFIAGAVVQELCAWLFGFLKPH